MEWTRETNGDKTRAAIQGGREKPREGARLEKTREDKTTGAKTRPKEARQEKTRKKIHSKMRDEKTRDTVPEEDDATLHVSTN